MSKTYRGACAPSVYNEDAYLPPTGQTVADFQQWWALVCALNTRETGSARWTDDKCEASVYAMYLRYYLAGLSPADAILEMY